MKGFQERNYDDIINMSHPVSKKHPQMAAIDRAAQFSPFAALTGHEDAIRETARLVEEEIVLDEDEKALLDVKLQKIKMHISERPKVTLIYFKPDERKEGGAYETICSSVKKIDEYNRKLILMERIEIPLDALVQINIENES